jgi:choice-of-anchor B domain-containing protein
MKTMKYFFPLLLLISFLSINQDVYSQLPNQGMTLIANRNQHPAGGSNYYSAIWGYKAPNGREYAILGCYNGTAFVDVTDTANVVECDFVPGMNSNWREMKVFSNYCYVVSEANNSEIQMIDLQYLPDSVRLVGLSNLPSHNSTHSISQEGPYLYLNGCNSSFGNGTVVVDITNPTSPVKRGGWNGEYIHDCRVLRDTIWGANIYDASGGGTGSIYVISAVNKDNLTLINSWVNNPTPGPHNIAITPDRKYALVTDEIPTPSPRVLKIWNIQNLSNVTFVAQWQPTGIATNPGSVVHNVEIYGNLALIAHYSAGVRLVDITNPAVPTEVAWYDTYPSNNSQNYNGCWGVYMFPSGKIIASDRQTGLYVLRTSVAITGIANTNTIPEKFELSQNYPNPFNPTTNINYNLSKSSFVSIKVFDVLGRQVALLVDGYKQAGSYNVSFDAARLSSGVYYYTLRTDNGFTETKKMILSK